MSPVQDQRTSQRNKRDLTSSSKSKNAIPRASLTPSKILAPFLSSLHPRLPFPSGPHPAMFLAQGTLFKILGVLSCFDRPPAGVDTMIGTRSGNPSKFKSANFSGIGRGGLCVVSKTSKVGGAPPNGVGNISLIGIRTKACARTMSTNFTLIS